MDKPSHTDTNHPPLSQQASHLDSADGVRIGESPLPGLTLKYILRGHTATIGRIAWSPDGRFLASPSLDKTIRIWDVAHGRCTAVLKGHKGEVYGAAWSPDGRKLASSGRNKDPVCIWNLETGEQSEQRFGPEDNSCWSIGFSPDGQKLACGATVFDAHTGAKLFTAESLPKTIYDTCWSRDGDFIAFGGYGHTSGAICSSADGKIIHQLPEGGQIYDWDWSPDAKTLAAAYGASKNHIAILHFGENRRISSMILEGHTHGVNSVSFSYDGKLLASKSSDNTLKLWNCNDWNLIYSLQETADSSKWLGGIGFHPSLPLLATLGESNTVIRIWDIDMAIFLSRIANDSVRYTTAKLVLVGDSGVGKTGLGWRLAHGEFKEQASTHGQQFWVVGELGRIRSDGTECEAVLWDLAGQPDYRLVHSLFLDDVDTAMILFDPTNREAPLSGVDFWLNQLKRSKKSFCNSILIGARADRGNATLSKGELQVYCERNDIHGGYLTTSALSGEGLDELLERLRTQIPWEEMTATVTTRTFKRIKEHVLDLKEQVDQRRVLVSPEELRAQLRGSDPNWAFSSAEMMTAAGHLANHGYVTVLRGSQGEEAILLAPDLLANLASSIVLEARRNQRGLGVLEEDRLLKGGYHFSELHELDKNERDVLLDAAAVLFLESSLCFRETFNERTFLVFPSLINERRPLDERPKTTEGAAYRIRGAIENVYASLVVLLGYTNIFTRTHQWRNQAQYETGEGEICGFQQTDSHNGEIELVLYFGEQTPDPVRLMFRGMFERFLIRRALDISRYQPVTCISCGSQLARNVVMSQLANGKKFSFCHECGEKLPLPNSEPLTSLSSREERLLNIQQTIAKRRVAFEAALVRVKGLLRDRGEDKHPTCFVSYAWGVLEQERWVLQLAKDLQKAGIDVLIDLWHSPPGSNLDRYIERVLSSDFVIVIGTPELRLKYDSTKEDPVVAAELKLINLRVRQTTAYGDTVLPILLTGDAKTSLAPQLQPLVCLDFRDTNFYFRKLFDMIWRIYELSFDNPLLEELQASMSPQRE